MKTITPLNKLDKKVIVPSSKSVATRALILASLSPRPIWLKNLPDSTDVINLKNALEKIGIEFKAKAKDVCVLNCFPDCEKSSPLLLETGDGGTTNRFLIALLAKGQREYRIRMDKEMKQRPLEELITIIQKNGAQIFWKEDDLFIKGPFQETAHPIELDCKRSSQFASALMLSYDQNLIFNNLDSSQGYLELTKEMKKSFSHNIESYEIPTDMSSLSYPLALGSVLGGVEVVDFKNDFLQPDSAFINILKDIGVKLITSENTIRVEKSNLNRPFNLDCSSFPDLVPTLCFLATKIKGLSKLKGLDVLAYKESDRLTGCYELLKSIGVKIELKDKELLIEGDPEKKLEAFYYKAPKDHRMVMMAAMLMSSNSGGTLEGLHHINKSYSSFATLLS